MKTSAEIRQDLIKALQLDLIGPSPQDENYAREIISESPSTRYLAGFLVPYHAPLEWRSEDTGNDELDLVGTTGSGDDETTPEATAAKKGLFPASMGITVLAPPETKELEVILSWGDYFPLIDEEDQEIEIIEKKEEKNEKKEEKKFNWQRIPQQRKLTVEIKEQNIPLTESNGLEIIVNTRLIESEYFAKGTKLVSIFLVNYRQTKPETEKEMAYIFQTCIQLKSQLPFIARPNLKGEINQEYDERVADIQYRQDYEYAVGHNVSALSFPDDQGNCYQVETAWIPTANVEKVDAVNIKNVELRMEEIASFTTSAILKEKIINLVTEYAQWLENQKTKIPQDHPKRQEIAQELIRRAQIIKERILRGINLLDDPLIFEAFQITNQAMARALRQRKCHDTDLNPEEILAPQWRPFQLAFILMNLLGITQPENNEREIVDLLFFPTGGGKTEAYLGIAAFTIIYRRLTNPDLWGAGISVIMRYTLRLLTLDQLSRASTLICALELARQANPQKLGSHPLEIGLWVGQTATPNLMGKKGLNQPFSARSRTIAYQNNPKGKPSPIPLENCPWCGTKFNQNSFQLVPSPDYPTHLKVKCVNRKCTFAHPRNLLPIVAVDEPIYRRLPCFLIATVDKFANLPWVGDTAALFGKVDRYDPKTQEFYGATMPGYGHSFPPISPLSPSPHLPPPDLIIQDELHLISGPLGTMVGLYETAIEGLCRDHHYKPKIIASTATVKRASQQIRALFGRTETDIFPPPAIDRHDSFFAKTLTITEAHPRIYVGVAAQGRSLKVVLLRSYLALLGAAQKAWVEAGGAKNPDNPADPYMTLLGYFNSLRELGGSRRIVEDEVTSRLNQYSTRQRVGETVGLFSDRKINDEPSELTSRESTDQVANTKRRLALTFHDPEKIDVALATNMISVGLDITRLGLMVVLGQPKTSAEYIQTTSRVGRDDQKPGLVITLLNLHRPRDRSHYERFKYYHQTFYRAVEAVSITPFSPRALDRGLAAITVALTRLGHPQLTSALNAVKIHQYRQELDFVVDIISKRAEMSAPEIEGKNMAQSAQELRSKVRSQVIDLLDTWEKIALNKGLLQYQQEEGKAPPLLYDFLDPQLKNQPLEARKFKAQRSLRDVEPTVNIWVRNPDGFDVEED
jgi:uncharacterized Zn-finger protein